jgi:hypothetical protein
MTKQIIWLHDKALSQNHPVFNNINESTKAIYIWDEEFFKKRSYSFKRLVFIYETLCQLQIEIIKGDTIEVLKSFNPEKIIIPFTVDTQIKNLVEQLSEVFLVEIVEEKPFVNIGSGYKFNRFFKYWNKAKDTAFWINAKIENE